MNLKEELIQKAKIKPEDLVKAEAMCKEHGYSIMHALESMNVTQDTLLLDVFAKAFGIPKVDLPTLEIAPNILSLIPKDIVQRYKLIPIDRAGNNIIVAMCEPRNLEAIDTIRFKVGYVAKPVLALELRIMEAIDKYYGKMDLSALNKENAGVKTVIARTSIDSSIERKEDGPVIKLVNDVLVQCLKRGASDIHIEIYEDYMRIRLRIDGDLVEIARPPVAMKSALISRVKIMAGLNIAESRLPQDGAINISIQDKPVDFRVNTLPTSYGEKIVMRILDKSNLKVDMTMLGFEKDQLEQFKKCIANPHGMVLVTGPTGSGKTTTLYSALTELNQEDVNVMTAEDPVEYNLLGINQVQMKSEIGFNFASALRSFLRQDPDIIMVGEIRDLETAEIAIKAALTGHLVLSTLHTNSATETISRLLNMGVEAFNLVSALSCVTAQRLMRKNCTRCLEVDPGVTPQILLELGLPENYIEKVKPMKGKGCAACSGSGMKGRIAVHEVLVLDEAVKRAILEGKANLDIKRIAMENGMRTLRQSALMKMMQGIVPASEVTATTGPDSDQQKKVKKD